MRRAYTRQVFINCPLDEQYRPLFQALVFAIHACGMVPRSALEADNGAEVRIEKIVRIISECCHSVHDISRVELDDEFALPRMNMPFELGLFLGAQRFGDPRQNKKTCIIFDRERYRYQKFLSDIAGQDIRAHHEDPAQLIRAVRNALATSQPAGVLLHSALTITRRYGWFQQDLPEICRRLEMDPHDLGIRELAVLISEWLEIAAEEMAEAA